MEKQSEASKLRPDISRHELIAYAAPSVPEAMILYAASMVITGFYATEVALSTAFIGTVLLISRIFDAVSDPIIGILSDKTHGRLGARKPWLIFGTVISVVAVYFLFVPNFENPEIRYLVSTLALYLGWTMAIVPYDAWGAEITTDYNNRNRIFTYRAIAYYVGAILFLLTPILPIFNGEFDQSVLKFNSGLIAILFLSSTAIAVLGTPTVEPRRRKSSTFSTAVKMLKYNGPLQYFIGLFLLGGLSLGITIALTYIYVVSYLQLADKLALVLFLYVLANLVAVPFWTFVLRHVQKQKAWAMGIFGWSLCYPPMIVLAPGMQNAALILICLTTLSGFLYSVANIARKSLLSDVIDYEHLKAGKTRPVPSLL